MYFIIFLKYYIFKYRESKRTYKFYILSNLIGVQ